MSFGKSKAKIFAESEIKVSFRDVAGIEEAKEELEEVIEFLSTPEKAQKLGGRSLMKLPCWLPEMINKPWNRRILTRPSAGWLRDCKKRTG
ncbi:hypothetical protein [Desulfobulbus rhabdoformis]|uniref:hypothetical protein n=1 Tax=Desulfobulbus rhabdoformis TaxID=34032 RepID=UPI001F05292E|nr:hypothetical protein [Desulfobulbus rhabdoformis]